MCGDSSACDNWKCHVTMDQNVYGNKTFVFCISISVDLAGCRPVLSGRNQFCGSRRTVYACKKVTVNNNEKRKENLHV